MKLKGCVHQRTVISQNDFPICSQECRIRNTLNSLCQTDTVKGRNRNQPNETEEAEAEHEYPFFQQGSERRPKILIVILACLMTVPCVTLHLFPES